MPTYEYACKACGHNFEIVQSFSEDTLTTCPACSEEQLRKVYNAAGIIFKGEGWHIKDYGDTSKPPAPASDDGAKSDGAKSDGAKSSPSKKDGGATTGSSAKTGGDGAARPAAS